MSHGSSSDATSALRGSPPYSTPARGHNSLLVPRILCPRPRAIWSPRERTPSSSTPNNAADARILWQPARPSLKKVEMADTSAGALRAGLSGSW